MLTSTFVRLQQVFGYLMSVHAECFRLNVPTRIRDSGATPLYGFLATACPQVLSAVIDRTLTFYWDPHQQETITDTPEGLETPENLRTKTTLQLDEQSAKELLEYMSKDARHIYGQLDEKRLEAERAELLDRAFLRVINNQPEFPPSKVPPVVPTVFQQQMPTRDPHQ